MNRTTECDSCDNVIVADRMARLPRLHDFALPTGEDGAWETFEYRLCVECRRKIVDFIDSCDESEIRVDMTNLERAARGLRSQSDEMDQLADELEDLIHG